MDATEIDNLESLQIKKASLIKQKMEIASQISMINDRLSKTLPRTLFYELSGRRKGIVRDLMDLDAQLAAVNLQIKTQQLQQSADRAERKAKWLSLTRQVREIRDKYQDVAAGEFDHGPSERLLAAQVVRDLNPLMKILLNE